MHKLCTLDDQNAQFKKAMEIALEELVHEIQYIYIDNYICVPIIKKSIESRLSFHPSGKLFKLEKGCNWRASYGKIEESLGLKDQLLYVIFLDETDFTFRAVGIPETQGSFQVRKPFREDFRGTRDEELQNLTGTKTANFCHAGGFIAGAKTLEEIKSLSLAGKGVLYMKSAEVFASMSGLRRLDISDHPEFFMCEELKEANEYEAMFGLGKEERAKVTFSEHKIKVLDILQKLDLLEELVCDEDLENYIL